MNSVGKRPEPEWIFPIFFGLLRFFQIFSRFFSGGFPVFPSNFPDFLNSAKITFIEVNKELIKFQKKELTEN